MVWERGSLLFSVLKSSNSNTSFGFVKKPFELDSWFCHHKQQSKAKKLTPSVCVCKGGSIGNLTANRWVILNETTFTYFKSKFAKDRCTTLVPSNWGVSTKVAGVKHDCVWKREVGLLSVLNSFFPSQDLKCRMSRIADCHRQQRNSRERGTTNLQVLFLTLLLNFCLFGT